MKENYFQLYSVDSLGCNNYGAIYSTNASEEILKRLAAELMGDNLTELRRREAFNKILIERGYTCKKLDCVTLCIAKHD